MGQDRNGLTSLAKGKAIESLVSATLALSGTTGLIFSVPQVDDDGIDVIVTNRESGKSLFIQIKSSHTKGRPYRCWDVGRKTCLPKSHRYVLCVGFNRKEARLEEDVWWIAAKDLRRECANQANSKKYRVWSTGGKWTPYKMSLSDMPKKIRKCLR